jgi:hypothetical protein
VDGLANRGAHWEDKQMSLLGLAKLDVDRRLEGDAASESVTPVRQPALIRSHVFAVDMGQPAKQQARTTRDLTFDWQDPEGVARQLEQIPGVAKASLKSPSAAPAGNGSSGGPPSESGASDAAKNAIAAIVNHIPTEVVTGYVAILAIVATAPRLVQWGVFAFFFVVTPFFYWLAFSNELKARHKRVPWRPSAWPRRNMAVTTFAFLAWAVVLPNSPMLTFSWYQTYMGLALAVMVGIVLAWIDQTVALRSSRGN